MGDSKSRDEFTLIENLGEFEHTDNTDVDRRLGILKGKAAANTEPAPSQSKGKAKGKGKKEAPPPPPPPDEEESAESFADEDADTFGSFGENQESEESGEAPPEPPGDFDSPPETPSFSEESPEEPSEESAEDPFGSSNDFSASQDTLDASDTPDTPFGESETSQEASSGDEEDLFGDGGDFSSSETPVEEPEESPSFSDSGNSSELEEEKEEEKEEEEEKEKQGKSDFTSSFSSSSSTYGVEDSKPSKPETFDDLKEFAQRATYGRVESGGNPPFSIILKNIRYKEDAEDIMMILREHHLATEQNEEQMQSSLRNGSLLIPQISEFSAVYLAHKFRRFDLDINFGLSDEIHPSKSFTNPRGLSSKTQLKKNKVEFVNLEDSKVEVGHILLATTPHLEGRQIMKYLGIVSTQRILEEGDLANKVPEEATPTPTPDTRKIPGKDFDYRKKDLKIDLKKYQTTLSEIYSSLADELRPQAMALKGNAIVGISYQITPIIPSRELSYKPQYQLHCTGNVVWVV